MLVEHLGDNGHEVADSPNTKIPGALYDLLLKEFASEKLMKEKAEQLAEQRKQEVQKNQTSGTDAPPVKKEDAIDKDVMTASDLRNTISTPATPKPKQEAPPVVEEKTPPPVSPPVKEPVAEPVAKTEPKVDTPPPVSVEKPKEVVEKPAESPVKEPDTPGLKVLGKIDLDQIGKKTRKEKAAPKKKPEPPVKEQPKVKKEEKPAKVAPPVVVEEKPKVEAKPKEEVKPVPPPKEEKPKAEPVVAKVEKPQPPAETEKEEDKETVIRAGDNAPKLSGLKVMGKIELPSDKPKKKADKDANKKDGDKPSGENAGDDKKRRRRRKRKRKSAVKEDVGKSNNQGGGQRGGRGGKEKPSKEEVDRSIRSTFNQMNRGASRSRQRMRRAKRDADAQRREMQEMEAREQQDRVLDLTEFITANEFANLLEVPVNDIITKSFQLGMMISINQRLDAELLSILAEEYGFEPNFIDVKETEFEFDEEEDDEASLKTRNPIITVMGHVDHGKTTLLDHLRKTNVTAGEAGGITQHIGAYEVKLTSGRNVTFLDTPGHEAFTAMRARGAKATDVAIIVVAADDAVMPQTREAINHAQAAEVPMIFALNKIDKPGADAEKIKSQLAEMNLLVEDWGGTYQSQEISALKGQGVDDLLEKVILEADLLELKANPDRSASGAVIEARLDKGRGNVATFLVQNGTLSVGDEVVAGIHYGKVRALTNQNGKRIKSAGPAMPVQVLGLQGVPNAGDRFQVFTDDGMAKDLARKRSELYREQQFRQTKHITLEEITRRRAVGNFGELNIIIRGDVDGSVEALAGSLLKLSNEEVQVNIIQKGVGAISEADVNLAMASDAVILAFNVRPNGQARALAEREEIDIRLYSVIYDAINDVKDALEGLLSPDLKEEILGTAEVREVFKVSKVGSVAGSYATSGKINKNDPVRIIRDGVVILDAKLASLKRFKDDVKEVVNGYEFGFMIDNYNDIEVGDVLESYRINEVKRTLS
ncbi:MAG: translation initiation factor IF-2 [Bacteroidota bacterium]